MPIFGLHTSGDHSSYISEKTRRRVLYQYPQGPTPLSYLLSLLPDEDTDKTEFGWWEERDTEIKTETAQIASDGPFYATNLSTAHTSGNAMTANIVYGVKVTDASKFKVHDVLWIRNVPNNAGNATNQLRVVVTSVTFTDGNIGIIGFRPIETVSDVGNLVASNNLGVYFVSSAAAEGTKSKAGSYTFPIEITNYTQIHKHGIHITRSALKQGLRYDNSGVMQDKMKKTGLRHMKGLEMATLRGVRATRNTTNEDGDTVAERLTGGLEYFLRQWELGTTGNGGIADYRPGGSNVTSSAWTVEDKRILPINGNLTVEEFDSIIERAFRYTTDTSFEKLVLCGSGVIKAVQQYCKKQSLVMREMHSKSDTFGLQVYRLDTIHGSLIFKSHPLLTQSLAFRNDAYIIDLPCFKWRPLTDSDTEFLEGRQDNDFDGRKDCWLTEGGYEINFPENHMLIQNLTGITD